jgi:hypothetical protein
MSGAIPPLPQYAFMTWCSVTAVSKCVPIPKHHAMKARRGEEQVIRPPPPGEDV